MLSTGSLKAQDESRHNVAKNVAIDSVKVSYEFVYTCAEWKIRAEEYKDQRDSLVATGQPPKVNWKERIVCASAGAGIILFIQFIKSITR